ncbi:sensor histidine kinase [Pararhodonellum marinum]|uniref:sensor histidine kinase n=1 Tax=Pararhodonellum marinum TaxID=2755358 RepID=UPI00188E668E|nr:sensor histidine kinase [Pararhodonellum marinum]
MIRWFCLFLFTLVLQFELNAQTNWHFNRLTIQDGLASNNVYSIWQDKSGFIWLGSSNGLQRFDGKNFLYFDIQQPQPLPAKPVKQILSDPEGNMWLAYGEDYGIFEPSELKFTKIPFANKGNRYLGEKMFIDSKGRVFVVLVRNTVLMYQKDKGVFSDENLPIKWPDGYSVNHVFEDLETGYYWISCQQGMAVFDPATNQVFSREENPHGLPFLDDPQINGVRSYFIDGNRNHWINYWDQKGQVFQSYSEKEKKITNAASTLHNHTNEYRETDHSLETSKGELWKYGVNSLQVWNKDLSRFEFLRDDYLKHSQIYQVIEDREGAIWLASDEGVYLRSPNANEIQFKKFEKADPPHLLLTAREIWNKAKTTKQYWLASWGRGMVILDENFQEKPHGKIYDQAPDLTEIRQPWHLIQEKNSNWVWVGLQRGWLQLIEPESLEARYFQFPIFKGSTIRGMSQDHNGNLWISTQRGDLIKYKANSPLVDESFELVHAFNGYTFGNLVDSKNRIWVVSSHSGVYCLDAQSGEILKHLDDSILSSNKHEKITQLNDSIFFFGYDLLNAYNDNSGENRILSYADGMISNEILHMQADKDGFLWIYTPNGICRYNYYQNSFTPYGQKDGLDQLELDGNGGTLTQDGHVIFTGYGSLVYFDPGKFNRSINPDKPTLTSIKLFEQHLFVDSLNNDRKKTFTHDQNAFSFYFSTLSFKQQDKLKYFYRLTGMEQEWRPAGQNNMAVYSLLPPGGYTLEIRSENLEGIPSPIETFSFRIIPPFHETWWFRGLVLLLLLGILLTMYRLHLNRILAVVKVRNRVARDLHDDMGSTLSTINILSAMAKTKLHSDPVKTSDYISKISDNSQRMMEAMDDIVWSIKPQNDTMEKVIARMREFTTNVLEAKEIDFRFEVEDNVYGIKLPMDARRDLFLVFKEAVNNVAKYSKCSRAFVHFSLKKGKLHMRVRDYGQGFDPQAADSGNGLNNMQKRAKNMGGELKITSEIGEGTEVVLDVAV